jgi:hypothetical protein
LERAQALAAAPIEVRSALDRKTKIAVAAPPPPKVVDFEPESSEVDENESPEWPNAAVEDAMRAELAGRDVAQPKPKSRASKDDTLEGGPLPNLDDIIARIPDGVKATLDELYRAKFESVRRVPAAVLKSTAVASETP